jgi:hypothetical protein
MFSLSFAISIYRLAIKQKISFRYLVGWLSICALGIFSGIFLPVVEPVSIALQISPAALLAATGIILVIVICVQLTISISGMQQQIRKLSEEVSLRQVLLEKQIRTNGEQKNNNE